MVCDNIIITGYKHIPIIINDQRNEVNKYAKGSNTNEVNEFDYRSQLTWIKPDWIHY